MLAAGRSVTCTETAWRICRFLSEFVKQLVAAGKASLHYLHPKTGWISYYIKGDQDIEPVVELFRLNYHRPWLEEEHNNPRATSGTASHQFNRALLRPPRSVPPIPTSFSPSYREFK